MSGAAELLTPCFCGIPMRVLLSLERVGTEVNVGPNSYS